MPGIFTLTDPIMVRLVKNSVFQSSPPKPILVVAGWPWTDAQARQIFRDLIDMPADIAVTDHEVRVRFHRRAHLPIVLASELIDKPVPVPWWHGRSLRFLQ